MGVIRSLGRRGQVLVATALVIGALGPVAEIAFAAAPSTGAPTATVVFLDAITFRGSAILNDDVVRVEIVIDVEGATRSFVAEVPVATNSGATNLTYGLLTPGGEIAPNTDVTAHFRLTLRDGSMVSGRPVTVHYDDTRFQWQTLTGEFVTVHWVDGGRAFGQRALKIGDDAVREVSSLLGVTDIDPIDFYIYGDRTAFYDVLGPGARESVGGEAHPEIRTLFANIGAAAVDDPWVGTVIPHELTHLVFDSAVKNAYHYPPRWLNEGIAVYESEGYGPSDRGAVRSAVGNGTIMPLRALTAQFPTVRDRFYLAYSESVSAVQFLVERYGRDAMVALVKVYANGVSDDEAFLTALGVDTSGFEKAWLDSIGAPEPSPFGPQPAPAGPLPIGWSGAAPTPGTAPAASLSPDATPRPESPEGGVDPSGDETLLAVLALLLVGGAAVWARYKFGGRRVVAAPPVVATPSDDAADTEAET